MIPIVNGVASAIEHTSNATPKLIKKIEVPSGTTVTIYGMVVTGQNLSSPQAVFARTQTLLVYNNSTGTPELTASIAAVVTNPLSLGYAVTLTPNGQYVDVYVTGAAGHEVDWTVWAERVEMTTDVFVPTDLAIVADWWRADMGVTLGAGNDVTSWLSQGPAATLLSTVRLGVNYPQYQASGVHGHPDIVLDGSHYFQSGALAISQPGTLFVDAKAASATFYLFDGRTAARWQGIIIATGEVDLDAGATILVAGAWPNNVCATWQFDADGAASHIYKAGALLVTGNAGALGLDGLTFGASKTGAFPMTGSLQEMIRCNVVPNATQRAQLTNYLQGRWVL